MPREAWKELVAEACRVRDQELGPDAIPPFRLSDVKRRQRRAGPLMLLVLAAWVGSLLGVSTLLGCWLGRSSAWYDLLVLLYLFLSLGAAGYGWNRVYRWFGLRCPYCGATFIHLELTNSRKKAVAAAEDDRRCSRCLAVTIDLDA